MKGGSLKVNEIKEFLQSSYDVDAPKNLLGYVIDDDLSDLYGKVYVNDDMKKVYKNLLLEVVILCQLKYNEAEVKAICLSSNETLLSKSI